MTRQLLCPPSHLQLASHSCLALELGIPTPQLSHILAAQLRSLLCSIPLLIRLSQAACSSLKAQHFMLRLSGSKGMWQLSQRCELHYRAPHTTGPADIGGRACCGAQKHQHRAEASVKGPFPPDLQQFPNTD